MAVDAATLNLLQTISKGIESSKEENRNAFSYITNLLTSSNKNNSQFENESKFSFEKSSQSIVTTIKEQNRILKDQYNLIKKYVDFKTKPNQFEKERERTRKETKENNQNSSSRQKQVSKKEPDSKLYKDLLALLAALTAGAGAISLVEQNQTAFKAIQTIKTVSDIEKIQRSRARSATAKNIRDLRRQKVKPKGSAPQVQAARDFNKKIDKDIQDARGAASLTQRSPILRALSENRFTKPIITTLQNTIGPVLSKIGEWVSSSFDAISKYGAKIIKIIPGGAAALKILSPIAKLGAKAIGLPLTIALESFEAFKIFSKDAAERRKYLNDYEKEIVSMPMWKRMITGNLNPLKTLVTIEQQKMDIIASGTGYISNVIQRRKMQATLEEKLANSERNRLEVSKEQLEYYESLGELSGTGLGGVKFSTRDYEGNVTKHSIDTRADFMQYLGSEGFDYVKKRALQKGISMGAARQELLKEWDDGKINLKEFTGAPTPTSASADGLMVPKNIPDDIREFYENAPAGAAMKTDPDYEEKNAAWEAWKARDAEITADYKAKGFKSPKNFIKRKPGSNAKYADWKQVQEMGPVEPTKTEGPNFTEIMQSLNNAADKFAAAAVNNVSVNNQSITAPTPSYGERYRSSTAAVNTGTEF